MATTLEQVEREHFKTEGARDETDERGMNVIRQLVKQNAYDGVIQAAIMHGLDDWKSKTLDDLEPKQRAVAIELMDVAALKYVQVAEFMRWDDARPVDAETFIRGIDELAPSVRKTHGLVMLGTPPTKGKG